MAIASAESVRSWQLWFENRQGMFGYPVLNGLNFKEEMIKVWTVPSGTEVVLASDGYPQLCRTLEESEAKLRNEVATTTIIICTLNAPTY